jgi:hypothetical protein
MDADVVGALDLLELNPTDAERFFAAVLAAHEESGGDWDRLRERLDAVRGDFPTGEVERFTEYADQHGRADLVASMATTGRDELLSAYTEQSDAEPGTDPWATLLADHGDQWADFTGTEESWTETRDAFYVTANDIDSDLYATAYHQLSPLDQLPMDQRITALQALGLPVTATPADPWRSLVAEHGADWAAFTGTEESWTDTRDAFYVTANDIDSDLYATAYHQLSPLDQLPMDQRVTALQRLGLPVTATPADGQIDEEFDEETTDGTGLSLEEAARILTKAAQSV